MMKKKIMTASRFFRTNQGRFILGVCAYFILIIPFQIALVSLASFFHLQMGHPLGVIEQWIFAKGPWIMAIAKIGSAFFTLSFLLQASDLRHPLKNLIHKNLGHFTFEPVVIVIVGIILILGACDVTRTSAISLDWETIFTSYLGTIVFYGTDFLLFGIMQQELNLSLRSLLSIEIAAAFCQQLSLGTLFPFASGINWTVLPHFLTLIFLSIWKERNMIRPATFLFLYIAPMAALFGLDPIWSNQVSPYKLMRFTSGAHLYVLPILAVIYATAKEKNWFRHRYSVER